MRCLEVLSSVAGCFTLPLFKAGQLVQQWVASSSLWAGAGWLAARVIGRKNSAYQKKNVLNTIMWLTFTEVLNVCLQVKMKLD